MTLEYKNFDNHFFLVSCDYEKYADIFKPIGISTKDKKGFLISKDKELHLQKIINFINMRENAKSRKKQSKYRRECSDDESSDCKKNKYKKSDPKTYYKTFNSRPADFKKINRKDDDSSNDEDDDEDDYSDDYSSSSYHSSSSDNFPSPGTPGRKYTSHEIEEIYETINQMQKRINFLEMNQKNKS
jgi:hypothetical protein